jgi:hypothetical protein
VVLDEIISILADEKGTLNSALLKTKVLLHSLGKRELATWVTNELKGYPDVDSIPNYRVVTATVHAHVTNIAWQMRDRGGPANLNSETRFVKWCSAD